MDVSPITKINYVVSILASVYELINNLIDYSTSSLCIGATGIVYKNTIDIGDVFLPKQEAKYYDLKADFKSFLDGLKIGEEHVERIPVLIYYKKAKDNSSFNIKSFKDGLRNKYRKFLVAELGTDYKFTLYDYDANLKYVDIPYFIDTSEFVYKKDEISEYFEGTVTHSYSKYGSCYGSSYDDGYYSSGYNTRVQRSETFEAEINKNNPKISSLVESDGFSLNFEGFKSLLIARQENLLAYLTKGLVEYYNVNNVTSTYDYIFCAGTQPVLLVSHLDTKHFDLPERIVHDEKAKTLWCPNGIGGDDRCGVYAMLFIINYLFKNNKEMPSLLFTTDEETGCQGAKNAAKELEMYKDNFRYLLEIDRRGKDEVVYYNTTNSSFMDYVESFGFKREKGFGSDVLHITDKWDVASCNVSAGYYNEHTFKEFIQYDEMMETIKKVVRMVEDSKNSAMFSKK